MIAPMRRRTVIAAVASTAALGGCTSGRPPRGRVLRFFTSHQATVVEDATARIAPAPETTRPKGRAPAKPT